MPVIINKSIDIKEIESIANSYEGHHFRGIQKLSHQFRNELMQYLQFECGFPELQITWEPLLSLPGNRGIPLSQFAAELNISKQHADQLIKGPEAQGFLTRNKDPKDQRISLICLTTKGQNVVKKGKQHLLSVENQLAESLGNKQYLDSATAINSLAYQIGLSLFKRAPEGEQHAGIVAPLIAIARYYEKALLIKLKESHKELKFSHFQVLEQLRLEGVGIKDIAQANSISDQAVVRIVNELQKNNYIGRISDQNNPRAKLIILTNKGLELVQDLVAAMGSLEKYFESLISKKHYFDYLAISKLNESTPKTIINRDKQEVKIHWIENDKNSLDRNELKRLLQSIVDDDTQAFNKLDTLLSSGEKQNLLKIISKLKQA